MEKLAALTLYTVMGLFLTAATGEFIARLVALTH